MKKITVSLVLFIVAIVLFVAAALVTDGHLDVGNAAVLTDVGLVVAVAGIAASVRGY